MPVQRSDLRASVDINRIVQGEALTLTVELFDNVTSQAFDMTGATVAKASFVGTAAPVVLGIGSGVALATDTGRLLVTLSKANTAALKVGDAQSWQIEVTVGSVTRIVQIDESLDVEASLF